jgi:hypothetical protein
MTTNQIPEGYMRNPQGHLIPIQIIKPIDLARDNLVKEIVGGARSLHDQLREFKQNVFADIGAFVTLSAEQYDAKVGGKKGNVTLHSFDGSLRVQFAIGETITFDERLQAAKELIDTCLAEWTVDSRPEVKALIQNAFDTDKEGNINTGRVLALRRLEIVDPRWQDAMKAISESVQVIGSKQYVRIYQRVEGTDEYRPISLDIASI